MSNPWGKYVKIIPYLKGITWCMALWRALHIWSLWSVTVLGINHTNSFIVHDTCQEFNWYAWSLTWTWNFPVMLSQESVSTHHHWNGHSEDFPLHKDFFLFVHMYSKQSHTYAHLCKPTLGPAPSSNINHMKQQDPKPHPPNY